MTDTEEILLQLERGTEGTSELRITSAVFNGHSYIGVREWFKTEAGEWAPTKKGMSIKPREVAAVIAALQSYKGAKPTDDELPPF